MFGFGFLLMSKNLEKLKVLTEVLTVRDEKRLRELSLYQSFFESIPVRTFVWSVDSKLNIRAKNKKALKGKCANLVLPNGSLNDAFSCIKMNEVNIEHHKKALDGNRQTYLSYEGDIVFLTTLLPIDDCGERVVYGCSWDVTNLVKISKAVKQISASSPDLVADLENIINMSPVFKLINDLGT